MILSSPNNDKYFHEWFSQQIVSKPEISSCSDTNFVDKSNTCLSVRSVVFAMDWRLFWSFFPWKSLVPLLQPSTSPNHRMFFSISCNIGNFSVFFELDHSPDSRMILVIQTIPILFHRFQWRIVEILPLLGELISSSSHRSVTKCFFVPYGLRGSVEKNFLVARSNFSYHSKKLNQVAPIGRTSWSQFSTLEKTKHGRHPTLNNLLKRSFPWIAHGNDDRRYQIDLCLYWVDPICPI